MVLYDCICTTNLIILGRRRSIQPPASQPAKHKQAHMQCREGNASLCAVPSSLTAELAHTYIHQHIQYIPKKIPFSRISKKTAPIGFSPHLFLVLFLLVTHH